MIFWCTELDVHYSVVLQFLSISTGCCQTTRYRTDIPGVQVWNTDFFLKKHVKFGRTLNSVLFKVCSIVCYTFFSIFQAICEYHAPFPANVSSSHFFTSSYEPKHCSALRDTSTQSSDNWKESSPVSKSQGVEHRSWVLPTCSDRFCRMWWRRIVIKKNNFVFPLSVFEPLFKQRTVQVTHLLLVTFSINLIHGF